MNRYTFKKNKQTGTWSIYEGTKVIAAGAKTKAEAKRWAAWPNFGRTK